MLDDLPKVAVIQKSIKSIEYFRREGMERKKPKIIDDSEKSSDVMEDLEIINLYWIRSETALYETEKKYGRYCTSIAYRILNDLEDSM